MLKETLRSKKGITLIALVITIIVMLILVGVSVTVALNGGLFSTAESARDKTKAELEKENQLDSGRIQIGGVWYDSAEDYAEGIQSSDQNREYIKTEQSYVGYYADVNNDGTVDGVIYADLADEANATGSWNYETYSYTPVTEGLKNYYISSTEDYAGAFGTKPVLSADGEGVDRFYVMALNDFTTTEYNGNEFFWYVNAIGTADASKTSTEFGTGKANTEAMINTYYKSTTEGGWGDPSDGDIWKYIVNEVRNGWFVPSERELFAMYAFATIHTSVDSILNRILL